MQTLPCNFNRYKSWRHAWSQSLGNTTRGTSRVQFANIYKEDGLVSKPPALFTSMRQPMHGTSRPNKVSTKVYMLDRKIWKLFRPCGNRLKRTKCDQFFCSTSDFFDFCNPCFFYHSFTDGNDVDLFVDNAYWLCRNLWPQFVYIAVLLCPIWAGGTHACVPPASNTTVKVGEKQNITMKRHAYSYINTKFRTHFKCVHSGHYSGNLCQKLPGDEFPAEIWQITGTGFNWVRAHSQNFVLVLGMRISFKFC